MKRKSLAAFAAFAVTLVTSAFGCELITAPDRSKIGETGGGQTTTTPGGGGAGGGTAGSTTGGGGTGGGTAGSTTGGGGTGGMPCTTPADCPTPENECLDATCDAGTCGTKNKDDGTQTPTQKAGDCKVTQCTAGAPVDVKDDTDLPDDANDCTEDLCDAGTPSNPNSASGAACGAGGLLKCNGLGQCVDCLDATDCGADTECKTFTCNGGVCDSVNTPQGTPLADQTAGDCMVDQCDGNGATETVEDNADPFDDGTSCTNDLCIAGVPSNPPVSANTSCSEGTGTLCDGAGKCVECIAATDCPGSDDECQTRTCTAGVCGKDFTPLGTAVASQTQKDCKKNVCDGAGTIIVQSDDLDLPDDNNACTTDTCNAGNKVFTDVAQGVTCGAMGVCDGNGVCVGCNSPTDCPGSDDECQTRTCIANVCGHNFALSGTPVAMQTANDCKKNVCDGSGNIVNQNDNADVPLDDGNECTSETCNAGSPSHPNKAVDTACGPGGAKFCSAAGACVECNAPSQCAGSDTECQTRTCSSNTCGFTFQPNGFQTPTQVTGDCKVRQCNGSGGFVQANSNGDVPADDGNECTSEICTAGVPSHPNKAVDTACGPGGAKFCSAGGVCVECNAPSQCAGSDTECQTRTCNSNACGFNFQANGFVTPTQVGGDCKQRQCNGSGGFVQASFDTDLPADDGNECTSEICTAGVPSHPNKAVDTACGPGGAKFCSAGGVCVECNAPSQCAGSDTECQTRTCSSNTCGFNFQANGFVTPTQVPNDCKQRQCNGSGGFVQASFDTDVPVDDGNECTSEICTAGVPSHPNKATDTACGPGGAKFCSSSGVCVECNAPTQCSGSDTECQTRTCSSNTCGFNFQSNGFVTPTQVGGDCKQRQCNGSGGFVQVNFDTDVPADDSNQCTGEACSSGTPTHPNLSAGTSCSQSGGTNCDGNGTCVAANCFDGLKNGTESDTDCGGACAAKCALTKNCNGNTDCASNVCSGGVCVECITPAQCPGSDTECQTRTCNSNTCGFSFQANGFVTPTQVGGDCQQRQCNGSGAFVQVNFDTDVPADDGNQCTGEVCNSGVPGHPNKLADTACSQNGGAFCDGAGACVACNSPSQCGGSDTECQTRTCNSHTCGFNFQANGFVTPTQVSNDCLQRQCNGSGGFVQVNVDADVPADDGNQCTDDTCNSGSPVHPPKSAGATCNQNGGIVCDGASACVQCNAPADCSGTDTECHQRTCNSHTCGTFNEPSGFVLASQTSGDCQQAQCNGTGGIVSVADNTDVPAPDAFECTFDQCVAGVPDHSNKPADTACTQGGGVVCNAAGACVQCNQASQCGTDTECKTFSCSVLGACSTNFTANGFVTSSQAAGDCKENQCDGAGNIASVVKDSDLPNDNETCTNDICTTGVPSHTNVTLGTPCSEGGGDECNGAGACILTPAVLSTVPDNNATAVSVSSTIQITFNQAMSVGSLTAQTAAGACSGSIQVSSNDFRDCIAFSAAAPAMNGANTVATLTPAIRLYAGTRYRIRVTNTAANLGGFTLAATFTQVNGFVTQSGANACDGQLVISQVYGAGGNAGATYKNDYVELHNKGTTAVNLSGLSLQYANTNTTNWNGGGAGVALLSGSIPPGGYFLVQLAPGSGNGVNIPTPDLVAAAVINMGGTNGKIALINGTAQIPNGNCPPAGSTIDFVGYGTAECREGTASAPGIGATASDYRGEAGCADTNANNKDFTTAVPLARNSSTPVSMCTCNSTINEIGTAAEADFCVLQFPTSFTVPPSTTVFGRIFESGTTNNSAAVTNNIIAQFGYGPSGSDPSTNNTWFWYTAAYNAGFVDPSNDEYQYTVTGATPGTYTYGYRFSFDGLQWTYCDSSAGDGGSGSNAGLTFTPANLGTMTAN